MVSFVGAGCGAADLITVRGMRLLQEADLVIYAGSLVNPELLSYTKKGCECLNSAYMTLDEVIDALQKGEEEGKKMVRLHTGDPCIYGAIREQMDILDEKNIAYDYCPGVSAFCGAASALNLEYTLPNGQKVKFLDDQKTYLGNQLESEFGGDRCFGILASMDFILVCTYEKDGENPELLIYKKR